MTIWIIVPVHGRPDLLARCADSIACQDDPDFRVVIADDASPDSQTEVLDACRDMGWTVLTRNENVGACQNIREAIHQVQVTEDFPADDVVLLVDGDDRLAHDRVISRLREVYDGPTDFAYGSLVAEPDNPACPNSLPIPADILRWGMIRAFTRDHGQWFNHPLSFRRRIFDVLRDDDFAYPDGPIHYAYDVALGVPMIEAAGERVSYVPDVLYVYSDDLGTSVANLYADAADAESQWVLSQPRKYQPLVVEVNA